MVFKRIAKGELASSAEVQKYCKLLLARDGMITKLEHSLLTQIPEELRKVRV